MTARTLLGLLIVSVAVATAQEGGPYPTGLPSYAKAATVLLPPAGSSGQATVVTRYADVGANVEGSFLTFKAEVPGDYLEQELQVDEAGTYQVIVWVPKGPRCGMSVVILDGERLGPEQDGYAAEAQGPAPVEAGEVDLAAGAHKVKLLVTGRNRESAGHELWIDAYVIRRKPEGRFIDLWEVAGPFGGDALAATAPPKGTFWRQVAADRGRVDFTKWMGQADNAAAWARATITSPAEQETCLWVGSDDGVTVWLNGEKVHEYLEARPALPDQDRVEIRLRKGENQLLLRVNNISMGWELLVRPHDPEGRLGLPGVEPEPVVAVPLGEARTTILPRGDGADGPAAEDKMEPKEETPPEREEKDGEGEREPQGDKRNPLGGREE